MSGAEDLARLTQTIDATNELLLSEEIKMVDVGGGTMRPTNAKVLADLSTQMSGALIYTSTALGLAGTVSGGYFSVLAADASDYLILYRNEAGVAVEKKRYPSSQALSEVQDVIRQIEAEESDAFSFEDEFRYILMRLLRDGTLDLLGGQLRNNGDGLEVSDPNGFIVARFGSLSSFVNGLTFQPTEEEGIEFSDENRFIVGRIAPGTAYFGLPAAQSTLTPIAEALLDQQIRTYFKQVLGYGQSLARGYFAKPAISTVQEYQNVMMASGVKSRPGDPGYTPDTFAPLVESDFGDEGETPVSALCNGLVRRAVADGESEADWIMVGAATGRGGRSVEQLSAAPLGEGYYEKTIQTVRDGLAAATKLGKTYSVWAYTWDQGESNYTTTVSTKSAYQYAEYMMAIFDGLTREIVGITGQKFRPYLFTYQVAAHRKYDLDNMSIALSQWRLSRKRPDVVLAAPAYIFPTVEDVLHLTNEASWLLGEYRSRAMYETMVRRSGKWRPLEPVSVDWKSQAIDIKFHVPRGELVLDNALAALTANFGFDIRENGILVTDLISSVSVTAFDTVRISLSRAAAPDSTLSYGRGRPTDPKASGPATGARGNLRDTHGLYDQVQSPLGNTFALHNACVMFEFNRSTGF